MSTTVSWHRQALGQLRFPRVCVATGEPATQGVKFWFQNRVGRFLPRGIAAVVVWAANRPVLLTLPTSDATAATVKRWRMMVLVGLLIFLAGLGLTILLSDLGAAAGLFFFLGLVLAVGFGVFAQIKADVAGTNVSGDWLSMSAAHPAFVDAFVRLNPPGMVRVVGAAPHQPRPYQSQPAYAPQQHQHPQVGPAPQQPTYPPQQPPYQQSPYQQPRQPAYQPHHQQPYPPQHHPQ